MITDLEHETLTDMDEDLRQRLVKAADEVMNGPGRLKAVIAEAAVNGERPADVTRAIGYAYTYDYVADLMRKARKSS